tara:strand:+ start:2368 stop:2505 length:138 start_codon:yes stop_codon:yes gene_type:complete
MDNIHKNLGESLIWLPFFYSLLLSKKILRSACETFAKITQKHTHT